MPSFNEHISQAKRNLEFLHKTNTHNGDFWDWQVTICFYVGVHLVNAHLAHVSNLHYRKHEEVKNAISPYSKLSPCKLPENVYLSYTKLQGLSRRARYLIHENHKNKGTTNHFTYGKHFTRAVRHVDTLMKYISVAYKIDFETVTIDCTEFKDNDIKYFVKKT